MKNFMPPPDTDGVNSLPVVRRTSRSSSLSVSLSLSDQEGSSWRWPAETEGGPVLLHDLENTGATTRAAAPNATSTPEDHLLCSSGTEEQHQMPMPSDVAGNRENNSCLPPSDPAHESGAQQLTGANDPLLVAPRATTSSSVYTAGWSNYSIEGPACPLWKKGNCARGWACQFRHPGGLEDDAPGDVRVDCPIYHQGKQKMPGGSASVQTSKIQWKKEKKKKKDHVAPRPGGCSGTKKAVGSSLIQTAPGTTSSKAAPPTTCANRNMERILQNIETKAAEELYNAEYRKTAGELSQLKSAARFTPSRPAAPTLDERIKGVKQLQQGSCQDVDLEGERSTRVHDDDGQDSIKDGMTKLEEDYVKMSCSSSPPEETALANEQGIISSAIHPEQGAPLISEPLPPAATVDSGTTSASKMIQNKCSSTTTSTTPNSDPRVKVEISPHGMFLTETLDLKGMNKHARKRAMKKFMEKETQETMLWAKQHWNESGKMLPKSKIQNSTTNKTAGSVLEAAALLKSQAVDKDKTEGFKSRTVVKDAAAAELPIAAPGAAAGGSSSYSTSTGGTSTGPTLSSKDVHLVPRSSSGSSVSKTGCPKKTATKQKPSTGHAIDKMLKAPDKSKSGAASSSKTFTTATSSVNTPNNAVATSRKEFLGKVKLGARTEQEKLIQQQPAEDEPLTDQERKIQMAFMSEMCKQLSPDQRAAHELAMREFEKTGKFPSGAVRWQQVRLPDSAQQMFQKAVRQNQQSGNLSTEEAETKAAVQVVESMFLQVQEPTRNTAKATSSIKNHARRGGANQYQTTELEQKTTTKIHLKAAGAPLRLQAAEQKTKAIVGHAAPASGDGFTTSSERVAVDKNVGKKIPTAALDQTYVNNVSTATTSWGHCIPPTIRVVTPEDVAKMKCEKLIDPQEDHDSKRKEGRRVQLPPKSPPPKEVQLQESPQVHQAPVQPPEQQLSASLASAWRAAGAGLASCPPQSSVVVPSYCPDILTGFTMGLASRQQERTEMLNNLVVPSKQLSTSSPFLYAQETFLSLGSSTTPDGAGVCCSSSSANGELKKKQDLQREKACQSTKEQKEEARSSHDSAAVKKNFHTTADFLEKQKSFASPAASVMLEDVATKLVQQNAGLEEVAKTYPLRKRVH